MRKQDGTPLVCYQHKHHLEPTTPFAFYHKQELLAKVEALHFLNDWADGDIYGDNDCAECESEDEEYVLEARLYDCPRQEDLPEQTKNVTGHINPLPAMKRLSAGRWTEDAHWNMNHTTNHITTISGIVETDSTTVSSVCRDFEDRLKANMPPVRCRFFCRHDGPGPLSVYPYNMPGDVELNILHSPHLHDRYAHLVVGSFNIVHIADQDDMTGINWINHAHVKIASELYMLVRKWIDLYSSDVIGRTFFRFVIERDDKYDDFEEMNYLRNLLVEGFDLQFAYLASLAPLPGDLAVKLDVCWADEEGDCPACQPDTCHPAYKTDSPCNHLSRQEYDQRQKA
jgi:hypothetical protein